MQKQEEKPATSEVAGEATAKPLDQGAVEAVRSSYREPFAGNVSKCTPLPPNCEDSKRKGLLEFDACFEGGNLGRVDYINEHEYDLFIRPDTCNQKFRVWFNFTVKNVKSEQRVIFSIVNFSKTKSLYRDGMSPLVKSTSRPNWVRIPARNVFYYRCPDHNKNYVLSFAFAFDKEEDTYHFAYCYPYSYSQLQTFLDSIEQQKRDYFRRELLCYSVQQKRLDLLTITSPQNLLPDAKKKMVFITARVHPGETPASYVCQGLIEFLVGNSREAKLLRDHIIFKIVPMLNPDGVYLGNYRCSLMGFDLNRHWHDPSLWAHPTLHSTKQLVMEYNVDPNVELDIYIDIHAHSTLTNGFMYGNIYDEEARFERQAVFPKMLAKHAEDFSWSKTSFNRDAIKAGTGRRFLGDCLNPQTHCYTLEVSFFSYSSQQHGSYAQVPYTDQTYLKLGKNVGRTFLDYYNLKHHLQSSTTTPT